MVDRDSIKNEDPGPNAHLLWKVTKLRGILTACMSGEVDSMLVGPDGFEYSGVQFGIIGAMTSQVYRDWSGSMMATGVLDRMSVLPVTFSKEEQATIENNIMRGVIKDLTPIQWNWPTETVAIKWDRKLIKPLHALLGQILTEDRNRLIHQLISLSKAIALRDGKRTVMMKHIRKLASYVDFLKHIRPERG